MIEANPESAVAYGLFSVRQAKDAGHNENEIKRRIHSGQWQRIGRSLLQEGGREARAGDRYVRSALDAGRSAVTAFASAAAVHGWDLDAMPATPPVILPPGIGGRGRVLAYRTVLVPHEIMLIGILRLTTPLRTALDLACLLPLESAVVLLDSAFRSSQVSLDALAEALSLCRGHGVKRARQALALADPSSGSIPESLARILFIGAGLVPETQYVIRVGEALYRVDFAWPHARLVVEIDGREWHIGAEVFQSDRVRQNALVQQGWLVLRFTAQQVRTQPGYVLGEVLRAVNR